MIKLYNCESGCPIQNTLQFISGKWKCIILYQLFKNNVMRFTEIRRSLPFTSRRMVAKQLRELEKDGIILKLKHPTKSLRTEYVLTKFGESFKNVIKSMEYWGNIHMSQVSKISGGRTC